MYSLYLLQPIGCNMYGGHITKSTDDNQIKNVPVLNEYLN